MKHLPRDGKTGWTADATLQPTGRGQNVVPQCQLARLTQWVHVYRGVIRGDAWRTLLSPCDTPDISRHSFHTRTQDTTHEHVVWL